MGEKKKSLFFNNDAKPHKNLFFRQCVVSRISLFLPFSWPLTKNCADEKKLPDAHIRWTIKFILNHQKSKHVKIKINIEQKKILENKKPTILKLYKKNLSLPFTLISHQKKKVNKPEKIQKKTLWKSWKKACFSLCIKDILKRKQRKKWKEKKILASTEE